MADPVTQNVNVIQSYLDAQQQQVVEAVENAKEEKRVTDWAANHKVKMAEETEQKSKELGHDEVKIARHKDPEERYPNDEKIDQLSEDKKKEGFERRIKRADTDYLEFLEKDVIECRKMYANIEYNDREKLSEARKGLQSKNNEESISTKDTRVQYENALRRFKDAKVKELEEKIIDGVDGRKLSEEEIKNEVRELVKMFGYSEAVNLYAARGEAKAETLMGRDVVKKCWGLLEKTANAYNKLPLWSKIGLSAAAVGIGVSIATGAAATAGLAGVASLAVGTKRVLGGIVAGVGSAKLLDAGHQALMKKDANKDASKLIAELDKIEGENRITERIDMISALLDAKIADVDKQLKAQKKAALCNKFIGLGVGVFLGGGYASKAFSGGIGKVTEHFGHGSQAVGGAAKEALTNATEKFSTESLTIEKGSSIERTLIDHIRKIHPDMKNPGAAAHRMWLDYMHDNKADIIKNVGESEYSKMLKDGMVNVKPGTALIIDEHNPLKFELKEIGGKISHLNVHHNISPAISIEDPITPHPSTDAVTKKVVEVLNDQKAAEVQQHLTTGQEMFKSANADYAQAANEALLHPAGGDGPSMAQYEAMGSADKMREAAVATVENSVNAKELYWNSIKETTNKIYQNTGYKWVDIKDLDYSNAYADSKLSPVIKQMTSDYKKEFGIKITPRSDETFGKWVYRVKELIIKRRLGINIG